MKQLDLERARAITGLGNNRQPNDHYPTPAYATEALLSMEKFEGITLEPACGNGAISEVLKKHNMEVVSYDLIDYGYGEGLKDFLKDDFIQYTNIITNPPYKISTDFMIKSKKVATNKIAFLLKLTALDGIIRYKKVWSDSSFPLANVNVFSKRLNFDQSIKSGGFITFAWFVWQKDYEGEPVIRWIK